MADVNAGSCAATSERGCKILYSSDNHGNNYQYNKIVEAALKLHVNAVIFGGDLAPKCQYARERDYYGRMQLEQREWISTQLPAILSPLKTAGIPVFAILGNGDVSANYECHLANEAAGYYHMIDCRRVPLCEIDGIQYDLVGLPFVSFGWSSMKDFEVHDLAVEVGSIAEPLRKAMISASFDPASTYYRSSRVIPYHSCEQRTPSTMRDKHEECWKGVSYAPSRCETHSMEAFLRDKSFHEPSPSVRTLLVAHCPPFATCADCCYASIEPGDTFTCKWCDFSGLDGVACSPHVHQGSVALREYIIDEKPWVTMHGHFHESAQLVGRHIQTISHPSSDPTFIITSGNDPLYTVDGRRYGKRAEVPTGSAVWCILFDALHPEKAEQLVL